MELLSLYTQYQSKILIILLIMMFLCDIDDMRERHKSVIHFNRLNIDAV